MQKHRFIVVFAFCALLFVPTTQAAIGMQELADSLTVYTGFSCAWSPAVKIKNMRVSGNNVTLYTNVTLKDVRWTPERIADIKRKVSLWVLDHEKGNVTIFSRRTNIETLVTDCAKGISVIGKQKDLTERNIALWPSHGLYHNSTRDEWIWQRATLWTTVEDLYSQEYVRLVRRMLENAGATVLMPRAGLEHMEAGLSGMPQWTEGARYWLMRQGADSTLWNLYEGDEYKDDMKCRTMWVNSLDAPVDLCLALHTDGLDSGDDTTIVGTLCIYTSRDEDGKTTLRDGRDRERVNRNLADWIQTQVTTDLRHISPEWTRRQLKEANYCETRVPVIPTIILELLSHKNMADMKYGLDPRFRFTAARAIYKGILRYLNGKSAVVQPLPVEQLSIGADGVLQWIPQQDPLEPTAMPSYYMIYVQEDNNDWNVQQVEKITQLQMNMKRGVRYNYYIVAGNEGGLSMPSPTVSAYLDTNEERPLALIVDGFNDTYGPDWFADSTFAGIVPDSYACEDGFSCAYIGQQWDYLRSSQWTDDDNCGWGACYRDHAGQLTVGNTHDWSVLHGRALHQMHMSYVSCTAGRLSSMLSTSEKETPYQLIDWVSGRQRKPLSDSAYIQLADYLSHGGKMLMSTDHYSAIDQQWARRYLHARYYAGHATRSGRVIDKERRNYHLVMTPNEEQLFTCSPEGLQPDGEGASVIATYRDGRFPAAVGWNEKTLVFGFPLEACTDFEKIYRHAIGWLTNN